MSPNAVLTLIILTAGGALVGIFGVIAHSGMGQAIADAIRHRSGASDADAVHQELEAMRDSVEQLTGNVETLQGQLADTQDRLDFAERLLTQRREPAQLPGAQD